MEDNWTEYRIEFENTIQYVKPQKAGRYLVCRKGGKVHFGRWNGTDWVRNDIDYWQEVPKAPIERIKIKENSDIIY